MQKQRPQRQQTPAQMPPQNPEQSIRLNKFLAERLGISRREADNLIERGEVRVNDSPARVGMRVFGQNDAVEFRGQKVSGEADYIYLALHKPAGYVCSKKRQGEAPTIYEMLPEKYRKLKTVGRLDKDSSGLILLSNDGDFAFRMTHPSFKKYKVYEVKLDRDLEPLHQQIINDYGVQLEDGLSKLILTRIESKNDIKCSYRVQGFRQDERRWFLVEMSEGRNRQIRRTFEALGYKVEALHRIQFGNYQLGDLREGEFRELSV